MRTIWIMMVWLATVAAHAVTISNVAITAQSGTTATIQWTTDVPATSQLFYGIGRGSVLQYSTPLDSTLVTTHTVTLSGVAAGTSYPYQVQSVSSTGAKTTSTTQIFTVCDSSSTAAGLTNVNGTVNNYYEYGTYTFTWVNTSGWSVSPTLCGSTLTQSYAGNLDGGASFSRTIPDTEQIVPSPSQWNVVVTGVNGSIGSISVQQAMTPNGSNLSAALQSAASGQLEHVWYDPATSVFYPPVIAAGVAWGNITGTLSNQTDLQTALNAKLNLSGGTMTGLLIVPSLEDTGILSAPAVATTSAGLLEAATTTGSGSTVVLSTSPTMTGNVVVGSTPTCASNCITMTPTAVVFPGTLAVTGVETLTVAPIFSSLTGYLYGNGASAVTASTTIPISALSYDYTTVNGTTCTLGSTCTVTAAATSITVGTTTISSGTNGYILYNNAGVLGNLATTGSGNVVEATSPTLVTPVLGVATASSLSISSSSSSSDLLTVANTLTTAYSRIKFIGTGRSYSTGVGNGSETTLGIANKYYWYDYTASAIRGVIDTTGQWGIDNVSPSYTLDVTGTGRYTSNLTVGGTLGTGIITESGSSNNTFTNTASAAFVTPLKLFAPNNTTAGYVTQIQIGVDNSAYDLSQLEFTYAGASSTSNYVSLSLNGADHLLNVFGTGDVTIGTTTDSGYKLQVAGTLGVSGSTTISSSANYPLTVNATGSSNGSGIEFLQSSVPSGFPVSIYFGQSISSYNSGALEFNYVSSGSSSNSVSIGTIGSYMYIFGTGDVTIGTATDSGYKLQVNGTLSTNAITESGSNNNGFTNTSSGSFTYIGTFFAPNNTTAGYISQIAVGTSLTTYDAGQLQFTYEGASSTANFVSLGLDGKDQVLNVFGTGDVTIGTTTDSGYKLQVNGTLSTGAITESGSVVNTFTNISSTSAHVTDILCPNLTAGSGYQCYLTIGQNESLGLAGAIDFYYASSGTPASNFLGIGFYGNNNILNTFYSGDVTIGTTTDSGYKLEVNGTAMIDGNLHINPIGDTYLIQDVFITPTSSSASCTKGSFTMDTNYVYVCTAANTWKRAAISTW